MVYFYYLHFYNNDLQRYTFFIFLKKIFKTIFKKNLRYRRNKINYSFNKICQL